MNRQRIPRLVQRGLARRRKSRADGRRAEISSTREGLALIRHAPQPIQQQLIGAIEALPSFARKRLARSFAFIVTASGIGEGLVHLSFEEQHK